MITFPIFFHHLCRSYPLYFSAFWRHKMATQFPADLGRISCIHRIKMTWRKSLSQLPVRFHMENCGMKRPCKTREVKNNGHHPWPAVLLDRFLGFSKSTWRFFVWEVDFSFVSNFTKDRRSHVDPGDDPGWGPFLESKDWLMHRFIEVSSTNWIFEVCFTAYVEIIFDIFD